MSASQQRSVGSYLKIGVTVLILVALAVVSWLNPSYPRVFTGFELHGGPVVIKTPANPMVVALTSQYEQREFTTGRYAVNTIVVTELHWDAWGFNAKDLSRQWTTRVATIKRGQRNLEAGILGVDNGTVWMLADSLIALSASDGHVIGDASSIESKNAMLRGVMPTERNQLLFDNGLVLVAANGKRWRINPQTLLATEELATTPGALLGTANGIFRPMRVTWQNQQYKARAYVVGDTWYGMMHPSELPSFLKGDPYSQDYRQSLRYRLWSAPIVDSVDRFHEKARVPAGYAPLENSPEFLLGSLLAIPDSSGHERVTGMAKPVRFFVLHQDRVDDAAKQTVSCIGLDGKVTWSAPLGIHIASGFDVLMSGGPADWAMFIVGLNVATAREKKNDPNFDGYPSLLRLAVSSGTLQRMEFAAVDWAALSDGAKAYRKR